MATAITRAQGALRDLESVQRLIASPAECERMAREARRQALARFKASAVVDQTLAVYHAVMAAHASG